MAKTSMIMREEHRADLREKFAKKRQALKEGLAKLYAKFADPKQVSEEVFKQIEEIQNKLDKLPRNSSPKRKRNRCKLTGRPRGYYRVVGLGRNKFRELVMGGLIPGFRKSSW